MKASVPALTLPGALQTSLPLILTRPCPEPMSQTGLTSSKKRSHLPTAALLTGASLVAQTVKNLPAMRETWF